MVVRLSECILCQVLGDGSLTDHHRDEPDDRCILSAKS